MLPSPWRAPIDVVGEPELHVVGIVGLEAEIAKVEVIARQQSEEVIELTLSPFSLALGVGQRGHAGHRPVPRRVAAVAVGRLGGPWNGETLIGVWTRRMLENIPRTSWLPILLAVTVGGCGSRPATRHGSASHGEATPPTSSAMAAAPSHDGAAEGRGALRDRHGEALSAQTTPTSLKPWLGALDSDLRAPLAQGKDVTISVDAAMHRELEAAFAGVERGAGVVIGVDGTVRALFSTLPHNGDEGLAARHLATGRPDACGSVAKPFTALAALAAGTMKEGTEHRCDGHIELDKRRYACHGNHGLLDLGRAMAISDNIFFYNVSWDLKHDDLAAVQHTFGLGEPIAVFPEAPAGFVPTSEHYKGDGNTLQKGQTITQAIGHGIEVTPLQVAVAYAALATGNRPTPSLGESQPATELTGSWVAHLPLIRSSLRRAVTDSEGTAHVDGVVPDVTGKTGTAQGRARIGASVPMTGWFAGWAPADEPEIAFAFRVEGKIGRQVAQLVLATMDAAARE